tara:strand:- start:63919 stop:64263 length:345 start_codon:yes stop_codon:yes gene_type:complete
MNIPQLDFTNWREHPTDNRYNIFFFKSQEESDFFKNIMTTNKIWFESYSDLDEPTYRYYFAVNKINTSEVIHLNNRTIGEYRAPFISNIWVRYGLVIMMFTVMTLAIIGFIKNN